MRTVLRRPLVLISLTAVVVGVVVSWEATSALRTSKQMIESQRLLVARRNLEKGDFLALTDFDAIAFSQTFESRGVPVTDQEIQKVRGRKLLKGVKQGEALTWDDVGPDSLTKSLGWRVPKGLVAYSLTPSNRLRVASGDRVDIIQRPEKGSESQAPVVEGAEVLAVDENGGLPEVVVAVSRHEIQLLEKALQTGTLKIGLRNSGETFTRSFSRKANLIRKRQGKGIEIWSEVE